MGVVVGSGSVKTVPVRGLLAATGPAVDPRRLAVAAQVVIVLQTVASLVLAADGGTHSKLFAPLSMPPTVAAVVVFLCWFRRCRLNAERLAPGAVAHSPGFAVGVWFVPVAMWYFPRRIMMDVWRVSAPTSGGWVVHAWWVAWLAKTVGGLVVPRLLSEPLNGFTLYNDVVGVVAAGLAVLMIQQVTAGQYARLQAVPGALRVAR